MEKNFDVWNKLKKEIDSREHFQHPKDGEIWWCSFGINIGTEICGKGKSFSRPVLIINRESNKSCVVVPITSKVKHKKYSCVIKTDDNMLCTALVYQIRNIDKRRLLSKISKLSDGEFNKAKKICSSLLKI